MKEAIEYFATRNQDATKKQLIQEWHYNLQFFFMNRNHGGEIWFRFMQYDDRVNNNLPLIKEICESAKERIAKTDLNKAVLTDLIFFAQTEIELSKKRA